MAHILIVDDEEDILLMLSTMLSDEHYQVSTATSGSQALEIFKKEPIDLVLTDIRMEPMSGVELLHEIRRRDDAIPIIMMTAYASVENAVLAMKAGAYHYLIKPVKMDEVILLIRRALKHHHILQENLKLKSELEEKFHYKNIVGNSERMQRVYRMIEKISKTDSTVLIVGESGTGKELVAKALHYASLRKEKPIVTINCAALPESLLESELFGHVKGAFTGAVQQKEGLFSVADGGTVFLDEVSATSPVIQSKLLRVLQEKEIKKVGDTQVQIVDVRIIAATNLPLEEEVKKKNFREDLFYRLSVIPIELPPLRQRKEDIPLLVKHFLHKFSRERQLKECVIAKEAMQLLMNHEWPGNIRELENVIERTVTLAEGNTIVPSDLPEQILFFRNKEGKGGNGSQGTGLKRVMEEKESEYILHILDQVGGDKKKAADLLEVDLATLYRKLDRYGLKH